MPSAPLTAAAHKVTVTVQLAENGGGTEVRAGIYYFSLLATLTLQPQPTLAIATLDEG